MMTKADALLARGGGGRVATIVVPDRPSTGRGTPAGHRGRPRVIGGVALVVSGFSLIPLGYVVAATAATESV